MSRRVRRLAVLFIAAASAASLGLAPAAVATPLVSVGWEDPTTMTVGGTATQDLVIQNRSDAEESITLSPIWFVPSCGTTNISPCETPDLGVFSVDSPVTGIAGACNGETFPVVADDTVPATGRVGLDPDPDLMLAAAVPPTPPNNFGESCTIRIAHQVLRVPTYDSDPAMEGVQTRQALQYTVNGGGTSGNANQVTVNPDPTAPAVPGLTTPPVVPGLAAPTATGQRAAALKKCAKIKSKMKKKKCKVAARRLPV